MSARIKSTASNSSVKKSPAPAPSQATTTTTRLSRNVSKPVSENPVKLSSSRLLVDVAKNKKTVTNSKPLALQKRAPKSLDLQAQVNALREDLKTAMDQFNQVAKEKVEIADELKLAQKISKEANEKLVEAVAVQTRTEEALKLEKLRVMETEHNGIEALNKETDVLKAQLASKADALLSIKQEMIRVKDELNQAIGETDQKAEEAKCFSDKVDILTSEISSLKFLIDSMTAAAENDAEKIEEVENLLGESVQKTSSLMESIARSEAAVDSLRLEVKASRNAEEKSRGLVEDWKRKAEELQKQVEEAKLSEKMALESLYAVTVQLEETRVSLMEADIKGTRLTEKIAESEDRAVKAEADASEMAKTIETLKIQLDAVQEKSALSNEIKIVENLLQEHEEERWCAESETIEAAADTKTERVQKRIYRY